MNQQELETLITAAITATTKTRHELVGSTATLVHALGTNFEGVIVALMAIVIGLIDQETIDGQRFAQVFDQVTEASLGDVSVMPMSVMNIRAALLEALKPR